MSATAGLNSGNTNVTDPLFMSPGATERADKTYGNVYNGKYHMPLLPGENGPKSGGRHVPYGCTRMTNIAGALEDTRALSVWEQGMGLVGLALSGELYEELVLLVHQAQDEGVNFEKLRDYPQLKEALAGAPHDQRTQERSIIGRAKTIAKAGAAAQRGTNRHTAWEHRGRTDQLIGTPAIRQQVLRTEALLADAGLARISQLSERVVRNLTLNAVGRFDDVLLERATGRLLIADLKTKATAFYSWTSVDAQLAGYAKAEWMLDERGQDYEQGPLHHVDQAEGVVMHVPSDGSDAYLRRADLVHGWECALMAKKIIELRSYGKSAGRMRESEWVPAGVETS